MSSGGFRSKFGLTTAEIVEQLRTELSAVPAIRAVPRVRGGLVRSGGQPISVVLGGPDYAELARWRDLMLERMAANPGMRDADSDYKETRPQINYECVLAQGNCTKAHVATIFPECD